MTEQKAYKTLPGVNQENIKPLFESYYDSSKCNQNDLDFFTVGYRFGLRDTNQDLLEACKEAKTALDISNQWLIKISDNFPKDSEWKSIFNCGIEKNKEQITKLQSAITKARGEVNSTSKKPEGGSEHNNFIL